jgi:hypothetical protein
MKKPFISKQPNLDELKILLNDLKKYYENLMAKYSIKNDLVDITDHRRALSKTLDEHLNKFNIKLHEANNLKEQLSNDLKKLHITKEKIEKLINLLEQENDNGINYYNELIDILDKDNILKLKNYTEQIISDWTYLYNTEDELTVIEKIKEQSEKINKLYLDIFKKNDEGQSKYNLIEKYFTDIEQAHKKIIRGYIKEEDEEEIHIKSYLDEIKEKKDSLTLFYNKIFGDNDNEGLEKELDKRLKKLREIEEEAKAVIDLSSDAGLASGFTQRGKEARKNKYISLAVFVLALILLGTFNFNTIDFNKLHEITFQSIMIRLVINMPFIWIAIVSNINLNKYARLEEEYAHKESLAKSFERYKEQIEELDNERSKELMTTLLKTNLEAFEKNPAETMIYAKSDMPSSILTNKSQEDKK